MSELRGSNARHRSSTILRGVATIGAGTAAAQLITAAAAPLISRLYAPGEFGTYTVIIAVAAVFGAVGSLRWELAVPIARDERQAYGVVWLGLLTAVGTTVLSLILVLLLGASVSEAVGQPELMPWLWLFPLVAGTQAVQLVLNQLAIRQRRYRSVGTRNVLRSLITCLSQVGLGLVSGRAGGLVTGVATGHAAAALALLPRAGLRGAVARAARRREALATTAVAFKRFPLYLAPAALVNVLGLQLPVILIAAYYGSEVAGWLGLTQSVLSLPLALIGQSVGQVYLGELARSRRHSEAAYRRTFWRGSQVLAIVSIFLCVVLFLLAPVAFPWVFGNNWGPSGEYARILSIAFGLQLLAVPMGQTLIISGRQSTQLVWDVVRFILTVGAVGAAVILGLEETAAVTCLGVSSAAAYAALWLMARWAVNNPVDNPAVPTQKSE